MALYIIYMSLVFQGMEPFKCKENQWHATMYSSTNTFVTENRMTTYSTLRRFLVVFTHEDMFITGLIREKLHEND
jgi:hypothetical protein